MNVQVKPVTALHSCRWILVFLPTKVFFEGEINQ